MNNNNNNTKHAAIYIRVSTEAQYEEGYSVEAQKDRLTAYCKAHQIENYEYYIDGGYTGSNTNRPELQRLIKECKNKELSHCIVFKLDRLSRSQKDTLYLIEDVFNANEVSFVSLNENIDTSTPMGKAMIGVLAAFAQLERETIMLRTRMGMKERVKSGKWMGGARIPYGYDYDAEKGILVPNENAETVRKVYELYIQGYSAQNIANMLGLKYDKLAEHILKRKTYYGIIPYKDEEYKGLHEPIITKEMYDEAQLCMSKRAANNLTTADHLLTGLVYCGKCNAKMRYQKWGNKGHKLVCYSQQKDKPYLIKDPECSQKKVWAEDVEEEVIKAIFDLKNRQVNTPDIRDNSNLIADLNKQRGDMERKIKNLYSLYADSEDSMLIETINEHKKKLEGINKRIEIEMKQNSLKISRDKLNKTLNSLEIKWEHMDTKEKQIILRSLIEKIVITDDEVEVRLSI